MRFEAELRFNNALQLVAMFSLTTHNPQLTTKK